MRLLRVVPVGIDDEEELEEVVFAVVPDEDKSEVVEPLEDDPESELELDDEEPELRPEDPDEDPDDEDPVSYPDPNDPVAPPVLAVRLRVANVVDPV